MRIVCDSDLVIAPADIGWLNWLNEVTGANVTLPEMRKIYSYNLADYFPDFEQNYLIHPHDYWDNHRLYDTMGTIEGAVETLTSWCQNGGKLSIGSHTKGPHFGSKYRYHVRKFPGIDFSRGSGNGFLATKEKYLIAGDIAIDDRAENLVLFPENVIKIYFQTKYIDPYIDELRTQKNVVLTSMDNPWEDINTILTNIKR